MEVVGIIPAAGKGTRLAALPISKEILPLGFWPADGAGPPRSKVASHYLIEQLCAAGIRQVYMIIAAGKSDIVRCLGEGSELGVELVYRVVANSPGTPFTLDGVFSFVGDRICALGFPDIILPGQDIYAPMISRLMQSNAQIVLGLFPAPQPQTVDLVEYDESTGVVDNIVIKPAQSNLVWTWGAAVWRPEFSAYMHDYLAGAKESPDVLARLESQAQKSEVYMGDVIQSALRSGLHAEAVIVSEQPYLDIGTPENLRKAMQTLF